jgi:LysM repeat protein
MKPFVADEKPKSKVAWYLVSGAAMLLLVWQLELVPSIMPANTGETAAGSSLDNNEPEAWDEIVDHRGDPLNSDSQSATNSAGHHDPLLHAIQGNHLAQVPPFTGTAAAVNDETFNLSEPAAMTNQIRRVVPAAATGNGRSPITHASFEIQTPAREIEAAAVNPIPAALAEQLRNIDAWTRQGQLLEAHQELSRIYWKQPQHRSVIRDRIELTSSRIYVSREHFSDPHFVEFGETLQSIALQNSVPWEYLSRLNRTAPEQLQAGQELKVIRGPFSAVVDLDSYALTIHAHGWFVRRYQIGIGKDNRTPVGEFTVENKLTNPTWYNPDGGVIDADDPQNPLGEYWIGLGNHIGIHGTIDPASIGRAVSRGCIHMSDTDIDDVYNLLGVGSKVLIRR